MMDKIKKLYDGSKEAAKNTKEKITDKINTYSGKDVLQKVEEYSQIYGDILIGIDKEISELKKELDEMKKNQLNGSNGSLLKIALCVSVIVNIVFISFFWIMQNAK